MIAEGGRDLARRMAMDQLRRSGPGSEADILQLRESVVPMPGPSMRIFEFVIAAAALGFAVLLGFAH